MNGLPTASSSSSLASARPEDASSAAIAPPIKFLLCWLIGSDPFPAWPGLGLLRFDSVLLHGSADRVVSFIIISPSCIRLWKTYTTTHDTTLHGTAASHQYDR